MKTINMDGLLYEIITVAQAKEILKNRKRTHNSINRDSMFILCDYEESAIVHDLKDLQYFEDNEHSSVQLALFKGFLSKDKIKSIVSPSLHNKLRLWTDTGTWTLG